jgi:hypothetical protein
MGSAWVISGHPSARSSCQLCAKKQTSRILFDHLLGERDHLRRDFKAERLGGLEVDNKIKSGLRVHRRAERLMSALGHERTLSKVRGMPLYPRNRTRFSTASMPALCQKRTPALRQRTSLSGHVIGARTRRGVRQGRPRPKPCRVVFRRQEKREPMDCDVHSH